MARSAAGPVAGGEAPAVGQPLPDDPVVLALAGLGAVRPEVDVLTVDGDDGLTRCAVLAIGRVLIDEPRHERTSCPMRQTGIYRFALGAFGCSDTGRYA